ELYIHHIVTGKKWARVGGPIVVSRASKKLDAEARAEVVALRKAGATYEKLREKFGISNTQIANILKKASV
ncbi:hypothetical protein, partial [Enterobacter hormaechei]